MSQGQKGDRVKLISCSDGYTLIKPGTEGTILLVDSLGTRHVKWDTGNQLGLVPGEDQWEVISEPAVERI